MIERQDSPRFYGALYWACYKCGEEFEEDIDGTLVKYFAVVRDEFERAVNIHKEKCTHGQ